MAEKTFTLSQALDYLDNLEVSSDSEEESLGDLQSVKFISSLYSIPIDQAVMLILVMKTQQQQIQVILANGNQLLSSAVLEIKCPSGKVIVGQSEDTASKAPVQKAKRRKKDNSQHVNKWIHSDISLPTGLNGSYLTQCWRL